MPTVDWATVTRTSGFIAPLIWHHGEDADRIRREIKAVHAAGIRSFVLEPRPHPDYLGPGWWRDVQTVIDIARSLGMRFWLFDDGSFPSGHAGGKVPQAYPHLLKRFLVEHHMDATGPRPGASFDVGAWLESDDELIAVVASKRQGDDGIAESTLTDLTARVVDGRLHWPVPAGRWRVHLIVATRRGGEQETIDYLNPVDPESAAAYIELVHAQHLARFGEHFGDTILGFFEDEPRFGNVESYNAVLGARWLEFPYTSPQRPTGNHEMPLPASRALLGRFSEARGTGWHAELPLLWFDGDGDTCWYARHAFMDAASALFAEYLRTLGDWCREHGVGLIGHLIEDNGAHARLGYGPGHYFRAISAQDAPGIDVVCQIFPGEVEGTSASPFGNLDNEFFYWGLAKLASSAAHLDLSTSGIAMVEGFGAYGWQMGLPFMKWLTDHLCVRGINYFVPHAFSPRSPDADCPPHFFDDGRNPQWPYFRYWVDYTQRLCALLSGGRHVAPVAVLYHAEAEWVGPAMGYHRALRQLAEHQMDADIVPLDRLLDAEVSDGQLVLADEAYQVLVVPQSSRMTPVAADTLDRLAAAGLSVVYVEERARPLGRSQGEPGTVLTLGELASGLQGTLAGIVRASDPEPDLRVYQYVKSGLTSYFLVNESISTELTTTVLLPTCGTPVRVDLASGSLGTMESSESTLGTSVPLVLAPGESVFLTMTPDSHAATPEPRWMSMPLQVCDWRVCFDPASDAWEDLASLGDVAVGERARFAGSIQYDGRFCLDGPLAPLRIDLGAVGDIAEATINGEHVGVVIARPFRVVLPPSILRLGANRLEVTVTTNCARAASPNPFDRSRPAEPLGLIGPVTFATARGS